MLHGGEALPRQETRLVLPQSKRYKGLPRWPGCKSLHEEAEGAGTVLSDEDLKESQSSSLQLLEGVYKHHRTKLLLIVAMEQQAMARNGLGHYSLARQLTQRKGASFFFEWFWKIRSSFTGEVGLCGISTITYKWKTDDFPGLSSLFIVAK